MAATNDSSDCKIWRILLAQIQEAAGGCAGHNGRKLGKGATLRPSAPGQRQLVVFRQIFLVQQTIPVAEEQLDSYQTSLRHYTEKTATCPGCLL